MKSLFSTLILIICFFGMASGQVLPYKMVSELHRDSIQTIDTLVYRPTIDLSIGWAPNPDYNNIKFSASLNRIFFRHAGIYTSVEQGIKSDYFTHILGLTWSVHRYFYFFGGVDLFTSGNGLIPNGWNGVVRKEAGVGLYPYKNWVVRFGSSFDVATTLTIGYSFPIKKKVRDQNSGE